MQTALGTGGQLALGVVAVLGMFLVLVAPHEAGHMVVAQLCRVRVYEFAIGMGNKVWGVMRGGTLYALRIFPIGGYVRLAGMEPGDYEAPDGFNRRPAHQRMAILLAGPAVNFVVAAILVTIVGLTQLNADPGKVVGVQKGGSAQQAGLRTGDSIQTVNGQPLHSDTQIQQFEQAHPKAPLVLQVRRSDGSTYQTTVHPTYDSRQKQYLMGISTALVVTPVDAVRTGVQFPFVATAGIASGVGMLITGEIPGGLLGPEGLGGPIATSRFAYEAALQGLTTWLTLAAFLSVSIGLANLLPIPALDGGRMVVVVLEKLRGRPFDRDREMAIQRAGFVALLALVLLIALLDVQRIATGQFPELK